MLKKKSSERKAFAKCVVEATLLSKLREEQGYVVYTRLSTAKNILSGPQKAWELAEQKNREFKV